MNQQTKDFITQNFKEDVNKLALKKISDKMVNVKFAIEQIAAQQAIAKKIPSWYENFDLILPNHLSIEQCSSEATAIHKAKIIKQSLENTTTLKQNQTKSSSLLDLTGGLGIDSYFISRLFDTATYVEMKPELCSIANHNFKTLNANNITTINDTAENYLHQISLPQPSETSASKKTASISEPHVSIIYLDPHRRSSIGSKVVSIADCTPNVCELKPQIFALSKHLWVKLSPMLDISLAAKEIGNVKDIHIIALNNECKEVLIHAEKNFCGEITIHCSNISNNQTHTLSCLWSEEKNCIPKIANTNELTTKESEKPLYVYEPNASILKAGLFKYVSAHWNINKIHQHSHIYICNELIPNFHGRSFSIIKVIPFSKKAAKEILEISQKANVITRNFPIAANSLRDKLKLKDGGDLYVIGTTTKNEDKILILANRI